MIRFKSSNKKSPTFAQLANAKQIWGAKTRVLMQNILNSLSLTDINKSTFSLAIETKFKLVCRIFWIKSGIPELNPNSLNEIDFSWASNDLFYKNLYFFLYREMYIQYIQFVTHYMWFYWKMILLKVSTLTKFYH